MKFKVFPAAEAREFVGSSSQLAGIRRMRLSEGMADGLETAQVRTGSGFMFDCLMGRCMDIGQAEYRGVPLAYVAKPGFVSARHARLFGKEFLRSFGAGLLTTCGLTNAGPAEIQDEEDIGMHGRIHSLPAFELGTEECWQGEVPAFTVRGKVRQARLFAENLLLERRIETAYGRDGLTIHDVIRNEGDLPAPLMVLYHMNFGFPLLAPESEIFIPAEKTEPRTPFAEAGMGEWQHSRTPERGIEEQVYLHTLRADAQGNTGAALFNPELDFGIALRFNIHQLPCFTQWKMMGVRDYVMGLEPGTCNPVGQTEAKNRGQVIMLEPNAAHEVKISLDILHNSQEMKTFIEKL